jgi:hypothetical protein
MGRMHLPLSSFEARPAAQALSGSHLRMTDVLVANSVSAHVRFRVLPLANGLEHG